jgi:hypothetical protein
LRFGNSELCGEAIRGVNIGPSSSVSLRLLFDRLGATSGDLCGTSMTRATPAILLGFPSCCVETELADACSLFDNLSLDLGKEATARLAGLGVGGDTDG